MCRSSNIIKTCRKRPQLIGSFSDSRFAPKPLLRYLDHLVLQNVYLYGWSEFGLGSGGWHDRLTSDTMIIANCWQLFWMFLWDAFKEFSPLSHVHVHPTCDRSCWGDAIDWRQYSWIVSAIVGTHLGSWPGYYVFLIHLMYSLQGPGPFQRTHLGIEIRLDEAFMDTSTNRFIIVTFHFWQF